MKCETGPCVVEKSAVGSCKRDAQITVKVSVDAYADDERELCMPCSDAFRMGVRHGRMKEQNRKKKK